MQVWSEGNATLSPEKGGGKRPGREEKKLLWPGVVRKSDEF